MVSDSTSESACDVILRFQTLITLPPRPRTSYCNYPIIITMGFDCGFDIYPRLEATASNKQTYRQFLDDVIRTYENVYDEAGRRTDGRILEIPTASDHGDKCYIRFMVGECPHMLLH